MRHGCYGLVTVRKQVGRLGAGAALAGCACVLAALALIWGARATVSRPVYVSELGAEGMGTRDVFEAALVGLVIGGVLIGWAGRSVRAEARLLRAWSPAVSLWAASALFLVASQVTCTYGCPAPVGAAFNWQDLVHTIAAVLAFCLTCLAMLQTASARRQPVLAALSAVCAWGVAAIAGLGGALGVLRVEVALGSALEFVAMTIGVGWVVAFGAALAIERPPALGWRRSTLRADP